MAEKFGHKYELYIGKPSELIERHHAPTGFEGTIPAGIKSPDNTKSQLTGGYVDYLTIPEDAKKITDPLQMEADIKYSKGKTSGTPQTATIRVYNLAPSTLKYLEADAAVLLKAGYEQDKELPVIFVGQVVKVSTVRKGSDNITTMLLKDGANTLKNTKFVGAYPEGQTYNFILLQMIKVFKDNGIPLGAFEESDRSIQSIKEDQSFSGTLSQEFTDLCNSIDYVWYLSKGKLYVQPKEMDRLIDLVEISADQVIGALKPNDDKTGTSSVDKESKPAGVKVNTFLNGDIGTHTYVRITYGDYQGDYIPDSVQYKLNWKNGPWSTIVDTQKVKQYVLNNNI